MRKRRVAVNNLMQTGYVYSLHRASRQRLSFPITSPDLTPKEMLELGVFGGKYMTDCRKGFPASWFKHAKLNHNRHDPKLNIFKVNASQRLSVWKKITWLVPVVTALTTWPADALTTSDKSNGGAPCNVTLRSSERIVPGGRSIASADSDSPCFIGRMIREKSR